MPGINPGEEISEFVALELKLWGMPSVTLSCDTLEQHPPAFCGALMVAKPKPAQRRRAP
jgi:hypothetical protein